ncbi:SMP-30/gluconolactonase/LRE family protein [Natronosporangium hydrolyticum]|uniref:SMP-30/gluconolactonase/LRE family protein n=1 Tax=Natronosporangium hydrolyticum TaxID=2811111 RepID=A0A895YLF3_9ACTN|nr:SMP-30/gluconolactonase/LRE family protein [Natronosporangium hydrolyticum]QSB14708.1 SMP-30/gluconolactonase/LRE family protein [Natronosporangium hydrolyticum]
MSTTTATVLLEGFGYLEGARWYRDELWCSDIPTGRVYRLQPESGVARIATEVDAKPSGLGFRPDGTPLVVTHADSALRRITPDGGTEIVASLSAVAVAANDMWVDPQGRAYITQIGYDLFNGGEPQGRPVVIVSPTGEVTVAGKDLVCPNGIGLSPSGDTLYVAETFSFRLTAFDVDPHGQLSNQRVLKQFDSLERDALDGLCVDSAGGIWVTAPFSSEVRRVLPDGTVTDTVRTHTPGHFVVSCALGGDDLRTLYLCTADTDLERMANNFDGTARIESVRVEVPGLAIP